MNTVPTLNPAQAVVLEALRIAEEAKKLVSAYGAACELRYIGKIELAWVRATSSIDRLAALVQPPEAPASDVPGHWPTAWRDVLLERHRQTIKEGWTAHHDDQHKSGSMALAAACYACNAATWAQRDPSIPAPDYAKFAAPGFRWPWAMKWWKPKSQRQDLIRAGALILAEIERLDRMETRK